MELKKALSLKTIDDEISWAQVTNYFFLFSGAIETQFHLLEPLLGPNGGYVIALVAVINHVHRANTTKALK